MEKPIQIAVCDDEKSMRSFITGMLGHYIPDAAIYEYDSGEMLLLAGFRYDIIFMDIKMQGINGMETVKSLRKMHCDADIVFVTGLEEYVFQAFDVGAYHYILKPVDKVKFLTILEALIERYRQKEEVNKLLQKDAHAAKSILVKTQNFTRKVYVDDILFAEVYNRKVILHTREERMEYYAKLSALEAELGSDFYRCHRAFLVHMKYILRYDSAGIVLEDGTMLIMAKQKYRDFTRAYLQYQKKLGDKHD